MTSEQLPFVLILKFVRLCTHVLNISWLFPVIALIIEHAIDGKLRSIYFTDELNPSYTFSIL